MKNKTLDEKFWANVTKGHSPDECWQWCGYKDRFGYGEIYRGANSSPRYLRAHRVSYFIHKGVIPRGMLVCHTCDSPSCVNPGHLWLGTNVENTADRVKKKRSAKGERHGSKTKPEKRSKGEHNGQAKLTSTQVLAIRAERALGIGTFLSLAKKNYVSSTQIESIIKKKSWSHL